MKIFGFHPVREALRHRPHQVQLVWSARTRRDGRLQEIESLCRRHGVGLEKAPGSLLEDFGKAVHNGFIAEVAPEVEWSSTGDPSFRVLLEDVQDPRNLGALLRVCDGAGVGEVLIRDRGSAPLSPAALKASAGAADGLEISRITNSGNLVRDLRKLGFWVYGAAAEGLPVWDVDLTGPVLLCFGGEEKGLRHRTRELCDGLVSLPMKGRVSSLNVATAAAAILFEALRQRQLASAGGTERPLPIGVASIEEKG